MGSSGNPEGTDHFLRGGNVGAGLGGQGIRYDSNYYLVCFLLSAHHLTESPPQSLVVETVVIPGLHKSKRSQPEVPLPEVVGLGLSPGIQAGEGHGPS